ncbi:hypothetical protein TIFTF001_009548 [Ficus carica]|uniref:Uncharacterized protein n=1 Tax=Ficus carica TaxID=3494 RepID=A0AA87ZTZ9_FICCA|nr:hypothetical protein TIFTF001_009548 [Ficus carica]
MLLEMSSPSSLAEDKSLRGPSSRDLASPSLKVVASSGGASS